MTIFTENFDGYVCDGEKITAKHDGFTFTATIHHDDDTGEPWKEHDGHGPVSDWTRRDKLPCELILNDDRGSKRFYNFQEACAIARRDQWGWLPAKLTIERDEPSKGDSTACGGRATCGDFSAYDAENFNKAIASVYEQVRKFYGAREVAARAARRDFEVLQAWCDDQWSWAGVSVTVSRNGVQLVEDYEHALWGIEINYPDSDNSYLVEVANDLAGEALETAKAKLASLCECEAANA